MSHLDEGRAAELLAAAVDVRVLVVGDLMLDRYVSGRVDRVSPEAPVPVVLVESDRLALGGAANVAANVTALGASCTVVGCVGDDAEAGALMSELAARDVDGTGVVPAPGRPTTLKTRVGAGPQQIVRFDREVDTEVDAAASRALSAAVARLVPFCQAVVVQDYDKGVMTKQVVGAVLESTAAAGIPLVVDPKRRSFFAYPGATIFKPNRREVQDALGEAPRTEDAEWMESARHRLRCRNLLVTLGDRGMSLQTEAGVLARLPARPQEVYDVSGAGDTVSAALALALAVGASPLEAAALANHAAAVEVQRPGVRTVAPEEVVAHVRAWPEGTRSEEESP